MEITHIQIHSRQIISLWINKKWGSLILFVFLVFDYLVGRETNYFNCIDIDLLASGSFKTFVSS